MRKLWNSIIVIVLIAMLGYFTINIYCNKWKVEPSIKGLDFVLAHKGLDGASCFAFDEKGDYFIAFKEKIQMIDDLGKSYIILNNADLQIKSIAAFKENVYFVSGNKLMAFSLKDKKLKELLKNIPNNGDYDKCEIAINGNYLYLSIAAITNSGVVGADNTWSVKNPEIHDKTPYSLVVKGLEFGKDRTGAFAPYGTQNLKGETIKEEKLGNASIISINLNDNKVENFAWGIRNVKGMDFNSSNKLIVSVGGMENRGLRPIQGDTDYIYEIKKNNWYGWPDFSGGDPVTSPRFKGTFVLDSHPTENPAAPLYQNKGTTNSLGIVAIDKKGIIGQKDCIYFYDINNNIVNSLNKSSVLKELVSLSDTKLLKDFKFNKDKFVFLFNDGTMYEGKVKAYNNSMNYSSKIVYYGIIILLVSILIILFYKNKNEKC